MQVWICNNVYFICFSHGRGFIQPCTLTSLYWYSHPGAQWGHSLEFGEMHWTAILVQYLAVHVYVWTYSLCLVDCLRQYTFCVCALCQTSWSHATWLAMFYDCSLKKKVLPNLFWSSSNKCLFVLFFTSSFYCWYLINVVQSGFSMPVCTILPYCYCDNGPICFRDAQRHRTALYVCMVCTFFSCSCSNWHRLMCFQEF